MILKGVGGVCVSCCRVSEDEDRNSLGLSPSEEGTSFFAYIASSSSRCLYGGMSLPVTVFCHGLRTVSSNSEHRLHVEP